MTEARRIRLPEELLPGSAEALSWLDRELARVAPDCELVLGAAWMLTALPHRRDELAARARDGRLQVGDGFVRLDPYALPGFRPANKLLAESVVATVEGAQLAPLDDDAPDDGADPQHHDGRAGLCLDQRVLADRIVASIAQRPALFPALLPALSPAGIGGAGSRVTEQAGEAALLSVCRELGIAPRSQLSLDRAKELPKRVRQLDLGRDGLRVSWSRPRGLTCQFGTLRETGQFCTLEVQGDRGHRGGFELGLPSRPRVFEARHMRPLRHGPDKERPWLHLERELRLPECADDLDGRRRYVQWRMTIQLDVPRKGLDVLVEIENPAPGQRYRLWFPVPFHPRPSRVVRIAPSGRTPTQELEGVFGPVPAMGPITMTGNDQRVRVGGAGFREVEVFARQNDWICAVTLLRTHADEPPPPRIARLLQVDL